MPPTLPWWERFQGNLWNKGIGAVTKLNRIENGSERDVECFGLLNALDVGDADHLTSFKSGGESH